MNPTEHTAAVNALERLAAELDPRTFATTLVTGEGKVPCLSVASRNAGLAEDIYAQDGWFCWSWQDRLAPLTEVSAAAAKVGCSTLKWPHRTPLIWPHPGPVAAGL